MKPTSAKRSFTEEQFVREAMIAGFVGMYRFWSQLSFDAQLAHHQKGSELTVPVEKGEKLLRDIAHLVFEKCGGISESPHIHEAFQYCGLNPRAGFKSE